MQTIVRHRDEGTATWFLNSLVTTKAGLSETGGAYCLMEHLLTADANPPVHVHRDEEEAFYVLDGEIEFEVDGVTARAVPGSFALAPAGRPHTFRVLTPTARMLVIASSPNAASSSRGSAFFEAAGVPASARVLPVPEAPDPVRLTALAADHGIEILPAGAVKLVVTVAHPDDEAFGCGSVLAHAQRRGVESVVACATRGELGEPSPGLCDVPPSPEQLGAIREAELRQATALLGVSRVEVLGWTDSGVDGDAPAGSLCAADPAEVEAAIARLLDAERPDVVVTLDASDGHRDHAVIRDATLAAVERAAHPPTAVYLWCLPRSLMQEFTGLDHVGTPDDDITTVVESTALLDLRWQAMRAHRSQVPPYDAMSPELQSAFLGLDRLRRVRPAWTDGAVEDDWVPATS